MSPTCTYVEMSTCTLAKAVSDLITGITESILELPKSLRGSATFRRVRGYVGGSASLHDQVWHLQLTCMILAAFL